MVNPENAVNLTAFYDRGRDRFRVNMSPNVPPTWNDPVGRYKVAGLEASIQKSFGSDVKTFAAVTYMNVRAADSAGKLSKHLAYSPKWRDMEHHARLEVICRCDVCFRSLERNECSSVPEFRLFNG